MTIVNCGHWWRVLEPIFSSQNNISEELRTGGDGYADVLGIPDIWGRELKYREAKK